MIRLLYILIVLCLTSCRTQYIPIHSVTHDSLYINKVRYDSIYKHDSVYIVNRGDTVYLYKFKTIYQYKMLRDTVKVSKVDTIRVPYPIERKLSKWEGLKQEVGGIAIGGIVVVILALIVWLCRRFRVF